MNNITKTTHLRSSITGEKKSQKRTVHKKVIRSEYERSSDEHTEVMRRADTLSVKHATQLSEKRGKTTSIAFLPTLDSGRSTETPRAKKNTSTRMSRGLPIFNSDE